MIEAFAYAAVALAVWGGSVVASRKVRRWWRRARKSRRWLAPAGVAGVAAVGVSGVEATTVAAAAGVVVLVLLAGLLVYAARRDRAVRRGVRDRLVDVVARPPADGWAYALGSRDKLTRVVTHIKIGHTGRTAEIRASEVGGKEGQVPRTHDVVVLAYTPGGEPVERRIHRQLEAAGVARYPGSEWFAVDGSSVRAVERMEHVTVNGDTFLRTHGRTRR